MRFSAIVLCALAAPLGAQATGNWGAVEEALGRPGAAQAGDVYKFSLPRSDLQVTVNGVRVKPALALGSWVAFKRMANGKTMAMGDLVLVPDEVPAVMSRLQAGGVEQSALHNHVMDAAPNVMYMHIVATGDAASIAKTIHEALATSRTP